MKYLLFNCIVILTALINRDRSHSSHRLLSRVIQCTRISLEDAMLNISSIYAYITDSKGHVRLSPIEYSCTCTQWGQNQTNLTLKTININIICFDLTNGCICLESCPFRQFSTFLSMLARSLVEIYILWSLCDKIFH
jgi:hypothetical protein